ncbi:VOC family protein [Raineyella fluvialis]|uniref:VOC family protein n=1 Tax=Raineyella fluvialis TaxID=2662261 RepID=A0A5Q2F865_9ACTN|nr:VOC family protein [Raineyella fluvialis]QGF23019.1 VOC family protein [Raineyella fluvialis]
MPLTSWPYLAFPGTAREAMTFYHEVFGGELTLTTYGQIPTEGMPFTPDPEAVAHAQLESADLRLAGGDDPSIEGASMESRVYSLLVGVDTVDDGRALIDRFVAGGGEIVMPFALAPWGDTYGQVKDRFGVIWSFVAPGERREESQLLG